MGVSWWLPMRNSNAFVGNLCTINLSCFCLWLRSPWSPKDTHSILPAWMPSLTSARDQPQVRRPSFHPIHQNSLLRDSPQVISVTKKAHLHIRIQPVAHLRSSVLIFCAVGWFSPQMCSYPPVWRSNVFLRLQTFSLTVSSHSNWPKSSCTALLKMKRFSLELIRHRQGSYWFYSTSCW